MFKEENEWEEYPQRGAEDTNEYRQQSKHREGSGDIGPAYLDVLVSVLFCFLLFCHFYVYFCVHFLFFLCVCVCVFLKATQTSH